MNPHTHPKVPRKRRPATRPGGNPPPSGRGAFNNEEWRASLANRDETIRLMAGKFRAAMAGHLAEPAWKTLLKRLQAASPEFCEIWERHEVVATTDKTKRFLNSRVGQLNLSHTSLWLGPSQGPRLVTYVPVDEQSRARLEKLQALVEAR